MALELGEDAFTGKAVEVFREYSRVPQAANAHIFPATGGKVEVEVTWTQKDLERGKKISYNKSYFIEKGRDGVSEVCTSNFQTDATNM